MERSEIEKRLRAGNFIENNGSVLRTINILRYRYSKLSTIKYALDITESEIVDCVNFLNEEGYIHLRQISTKEAASLADTPFDDIEAKLSGDGIRLLAGGTKDPLIKV